MRERVNSIVNKYWDSFCKEGAKRTILGYEFPIDTGNTKSVCCRKPQYGPYESKIIMVQLKALLGNEWIECCRVPWGSSIVLALNRIKSIYIILMISYGSCAFRTESSILSLNHLNLRFQYVTALSAQ